MLFVLSENFQLESDQLVRLVPFRWDGILKNRITIAAKGRHLG